MLFLKKWIILWFILMIVIQANQPANAQTPTPQLHLTQLALMGRGYVNGIAWSPNGRLLAVATSIGIWLYNTANFSQEPRLFEGYSEAIWFSPDSKRIASNGLDRYLTIWTISTGKKVSTL